MARGKSYTNEEMMLLHALRRLEQTGVCSKPYILEVACEITHRTHIAIQTQLNRMLNPATGWAPIDKILTPPIKETPKSNIITKENILDHVGKIVKVYCYELKEYGAFCQIIGTDVQALLHISKISFDYVENISDWIAIGDTVEAVILPESRPEKIALTTKGLLKKKE